MGKGSLVEGKEVWWLPLYLSCHLTDTPKIYARQSYVHTHNSNKFMHDIIVLYCSFPYNNVAECPLTAIDMPFYILT